MTMLLRLFSQLVLVTSFYGIHGYTNAEKKALLMTGFTDLSRETIDGKVTVESGSIPTWLNGNFIRHGCSAFGEVEHMNNSGPNYVQHLFDCIESGTRFKIENGHVTFTNRFYDTLVNDFYNLYGRNMNKSGMFFPGTFSKTNVSMMHKWDAFATNSSKLAGVPQVSWWKIGNHAIAMSESPDGVVIDPNTVEQKGTVKYLDKNLGYGSDVTFTNNPAHEHTERDGTLWSTVAAVRFISRTRLNIWRAVYKVSANGMRKVIGEYHYDDADLTKCSHYKPGSSYPDFGSRFGYLHSFGLTEKYVVLPEAGYMHDPCFYTHYKDSEPFFPQSFKYEQKGFSRLLVMRKSDGSFIATVKTKPFFATHQLGSYEERDLIHMDMLTYNDSSIYTKTTFVNSFLANNVYITNVTRITINTTSWTASFKNLRTGPPGAYEMSNINYAYNGRKYTYGYMVKNFDRADPNAITKLNVDTGKEIEYVFPEGMFAQEPQFIPSPTPTSEDDGVLLVQGVDGTKNKGFLVVIDAKTMTLISHVTAHAEAKFGIHNRFFDLSVGKTVSGTEILGKR